MCAGVNAEKHFSNFHIHFRFHFSCISWLNENHWAEKKKKQSMPNKRYLVLFLYGSFFLTFVQKKRKKKKFSWIVPITDGDDVVVQIIKY